MRILFASGLLTAVVAFLCAANAAFAQVPDVSGQWSTMRPSGRYDIVLTQDGNKVTGTVHLGRMQGTLSGNVMTGVFEDINGRGPFEITFSTDGTHFQGGIQFGNGTKRWTGARVGTLATTPEGIMRSRARLDEVQTSGDPYPEQAQKACRNLFVAVYAPTNDDWTTSINVGPNPFTPVLGAPSGVTDMLDQRREN